MNKRNILITLGVVIVVAAILAIIWGGSSGQPSADTPTGSGKVPPNLVVPDKGDQNAPKGVAVPQMQAPENQSGSSQLRIYSIAIKNGAYNPAQINVHLGDVVRIDMTAVDAAYGFSQPNYGFSIAIPKGKTQRIEFSANIAGEFKFYCASCGGPAKGPVGYLMVQ